VHIDWYDIALRLACTIAAGAAIGFDRGEHGRPAGLRTTILVALAACIAMLQADLLLPMRGKAPDSFVVLDLMRLPLGILSGMGFIGAGAILRRNDLVVGVTTAATLWFVTVVGLCFGGGQIGLGAAASVLGIGVLTGLRQVDSRMRQDHHGTLQVTENQDGPSEDEIRTMLTAHRFKIVSSSLLSAAQGAQRELMLAVTWRADAGETKVPAAIHALTRHAGVLKVVWNAKAPMARFDSSGDGLL
jgi:putative Mg2+ transporter-C (MgtC) family protein